MNPKALRPSTSAKAMAVNHRAGIIHCRFARKNQLVTIAAWKINAFVLHQAYLFLRHRCEELRQKAALFSSAHSSPPSTVTSACQPHQFLRRTDPPTLCLCSHPKGGHLILGFLECVIEANRVTLSTEALGFFAFGPAPAHNSRVLVADQRPGESGAITSRSYALRTI